MSLRVAVEIRLQNLVGCYAWTTFLRGSGVFLRPLAFSGTLLASSFSLALRQGHRRWPQCVTAAIFWLKTRGGWKEPVLSDENLPPPKLVISWNPHAADGPAEQKMPPVPQWIEHR